MEQYDGISEHIALWEIIMTHVANVYGSMEDYFESIDISLRIIMEYNQCY